MIPRLNLADSGYTTLEKKKKMKESSHNFFTWVADRGEWKENVFIILFSFPISNKHLFHPRQLPFLIKYIFYEGETGLCASLFFLVYIEA